MNESVLGTNNNHLTQHAYDELTDMQSTGRTKTAAELRSMQRIQTATESPSMHNMKTVICYPASNSELSNMHTMNYPTCKGYANKNY